MLLALLSFVFDLITWPAANPEVTQGERANLKKLNYRLLAQYYNTKIKQKTQPMDGGGDHPNVLPSYPPLYMYTMTLYTWPCITISTDKDAWP